MENHKQPPWHAQNVEEIYETFSTSEEGLSDAEAAERLQKNGRNVLRSRPPKTL